MTALPLSHEVLYPESDGQPMGESDLHRDEILDLIAALKERFRQQADVYVAGNLFLYHVQGDPRAVVAPDVFLVRGVAKEPRRVYKLWEEGKAPSFVVEVTSRHTADEDLSRKKACYESLGVEEYFLHDPLGEALEPRLQGFRRTGGRFRPLRPGRDGSLRSEVTGLTLRREGLRLRLLDTATAEPLLRPDELQARILLEQARTLELQSRIQEESAARRAAEEEIVRLKEELERARRGR
jgi:Uma2 family endonuclease